MNTSTNLLDENVQKYSSSTEQIPNRCRTILWYMIFTGCAIDSMTRMNLSIAIVDMIIPKNISNIVVAAATTETNSKQYYSSSSSSSQCIQQDNYNAFGSSTILPKNSSKFSHNLSLTTYENEHQRFSIERIIFDALKVLKKKNGVVDGVKCIIA